MTEEMPPLIVDQILIGPLFNEPMRVESVQSNGDASWIVGLVGTNSERFRKVTITAGDLELLTIFDPQHSFDGNGQLLRLGLQAYAMGIAASRSANADMARRVSRPLIIIDYYPFVQPASHQGT